MAEVNVHGDDLARHKPSFDGCAICVEAVARHCHVWTYMDPARLQPIWQALVQGSQLLTYIRLRYAA